MNAVAIPTNRSGAKRATTSPAPLPMTTTPDRIGASFRQIGLHLRNAAQAEADGGLLSGHSIRLLSAAASMAGAHGGRGWSATGGQNEGYDIAALVIAALCVEKDRLDAYALGEIEDENVLEGALRRYI